MYILGFEGFVGRLLDVKSVIGVGTPWLDGFEVTFVGTETSVVTNDGLGLSMPFNVVLLKYVFIEILLGVYTDDGYNVEEVVPWELGLLDGLVGFGFTRPGLPWDGGFGLLFGFVVGFDGGFEYAVVTSAGDGLWVAVWYTVDSVVEYTRGAAVTCDTDVCIKVTFTKGVREVIGIVSCDPVEFV